MLDIQLRDIVAHGHLPTPPRTRAQVNLGVGLRTANDLDFAKLMYVDEDIAHITSNDPALLERFEHSHWVIIWKRELHSPSRNSKISAIIARPGEKEPTC